MSVFLLSLLLLLILILLIIIIIITNSIFIRISIIDYFIKVIVQHMFILSYGYFYSFLVVHAIF
jgi:hypothetical protein